jgi:hypothetical protein
MDYALARPQIRTGDLIGVRDVHGLLGRATTFFTHDPHTHTGVAVWLGERLFMADLNSGRNHLTAVSCLEKFDVYAPPLRLSRDLIETAIFDWLASPITYGYAAFIVIGLKCALRLKTFIHWRRIVVCSGGSVEIYEKAAAAARNLRNITVAGWQEHNRMISPGELCAELQLKFPVGY